MPVGIARDLGEQVAPVTGQTLDGVRVEEVRPVLELAPQPVGVVGLQHQGQVDLGVAGHDGERLHGEAGERGGADEIRRMENMAWNTGLRPDARDSASASTSRSSGTS